MNNSLDIYNPRSDYYNDICYKTISEHRTDISLKKRRKTFVEKNMTLCEENCELVEYNYTKETVKCSCDIKTSLSENNIIRFDQKEFYKSFIKTKNNNI